MSDNHGNTPAAWIGVSVAMLGFVLGSVALMLSPINMPIFWVGVALFVVSPFLFAMLNRMGFGDSGH